MRKFSVMALLWALTLAPAVGGCGYNEVIERDEDVKSSWAEVQNQYKRRSDLVPNLVNTVKGFAARNGNPMGFLRVLVFPDKREMTFWFGDPND